jgi:hypothetical protein
MSVTLQTLFRRVRKALANDGEILRRGREDRSWTDTGDYYTTDENRCMWRRHLNLEEAARELGLLAEHEVVAGE